MRTGEQLRMVRRRLRITIRDVEEHSRTIARLEGNGRFYISNAWLSKIETRNTVPSIYKLYSLSVIYRIKFTELLRLCGLDLDRISRHELDTPLGETHLTALEVYDQERAIKFPVRLAPVFEPEKTGLLSRLVEVWGEVPIALIRHLDLRRHLYGYIGLQDYTLAPLLRPGSFVQIDDRQNKVCLSEWRSEFDRPIYFVETRGGYARAWCDLQGHRLTLLPHPLSGYPVRQFAYPAEAEIVGLVTGVAMRLVTHSGTAPLEPARFPPHS